MVLHVAHGATVVKITSLKALALIVGGILSALGLIKKMLSEGHWVIKHGSTEVERMDKSAIAAA